MLKKSFNLLKSNPVLILFYVAYLIATMLIIYALYPKDLSQYTNPNVISFDFAAYLITMMKLLIAAFLMYVLGIIFFSGFGNMITDAITSGKTSAASFLPGLKKYFVRVLLGSLLLMAFSIGFSIVISIITVPITFLSIANGSGSINLLTIIITLISSLVIILALPFVLLWFPSIFIDDAGVIQGLVKGVKAGVKNYWKLILVLLITYFPAVVNITINFNSIEKGIIFTPGYIVMYILTALMSMVVFPIIFLIYKESKQIQANTIKEV